MWSSPRTFADGEVERARYFNSTVRDNMRELGGYYAEILTVEGTTTTTYTDLTTVGPHVDCILGGTQATIFIGASIYPMAAARCEGWISFQAAVSGVNLFGANDNWSAAVDNTAQNRDVTQCWMDIVPNSGTGGSIAAGSPVTFTAKYRAANANGANFQRRFMYVIPAGP